MELGKLLSRQRRKKASDQVFLRGYDLHVQPAPGGCEVQAIGPAVLAALDQPVALHTIDQLAYISLGHQQGPCQILLREALTAAHFYQEIELSHAQAPPAQMVGRGTVNALKDACQTKPTQNFQGWPRRPVQDRSTDTHQFIPKLTET